MSPHLGKTLFLLGLGLMVLGALLWLGGGSLLGWFGRLPGFRLYVPWVSMLLVSAALSALLWLVRKLGE